MKNNEKNSKKEKKNRSKWTAQPFSLGYPRDERSLPSVVMLLLLLLVNLLKLLLLPVRSRGRCERVLLTTAQTDLVAEGRRGRSRGRRGDSTVDGSRSDRVVDVEPGPFGHRLHVMLLLLLLVVGDLMLGGGDDGLDGVVRRRSRRRSGRSDVHRFVLVLEGGRGGRE